MAGALCSGCPCHPDVQAEHERLEARAKEVLDHIDRAVVKSPEFTLRDGTCCGVSGFHARELSTDGDLRCAFDVRMPDGHLEFTIGDTGSGGAFAPQETSRNPAAAVPAERVPSVR